MKSLSLDHASLDVGSAPAQSISTRLQVFFSEAMQQWAAAREDRRLQAELSALGDDVLRDIGLESDEIAHLRAGDDQLPKSWMQIAVLK